MKNLIILAILAVTFGTVPAIQHKRAQKVKRPCDDVRALDTLYRVNPVATVK